MCEWQMWHLTSFVCESVSCSSLDDANTLSDKAACVDCHIVSVEINRFGRNQNNNLLSGVQTVSIPVACCSADEASVSKQEQECKKKRRSERGKT